MGTSGAIRGRVLVVAIVAALIATACGASTSTSTPLAGIDSTLGSQGPSSGVTPSPATKPVKAPKPTPRPTAPKPKPTACRGVIPSSLSALQGPLRLPLGPTTSAKLWYVVDGDTIRLSNGEYVRLIGMDTPETVKPGTPVQRYGPQASADLKRMLAGRSSVILEKDVSNTDWYGRLLRFVWIRSGTAWLQLDYELVVRGDARIDTIAPDVRYESDYASAERVAQAHHVGRWATC
jgi:endonuclease YncB( thermonuclease family)